MNKFCAMILIVVQYQIVEMLCIGSWESHTADFIGFHNCVWVYQYITVPCVGGGPIPRDGFGGGH